MIVYKVVKTTAYGHPYYFSSYISAFHGGLKYIIGEPTVPEIEKSPLMAFDSLDSAETFIVQQEAAMRLKILKCRAKEMKFSRKVVLAIPNECCSHEIPTFWSTFFSGKPRRYELPVMPAPDGTVFCSKITPINVID